MLLAGEQRGTGQTRGGVRGSWAQSKEFLMKAGRLKNLKGTRNDLGWGVLTSECDHSSK